MYNTVLTQLYFLLQLHSYYLSQHNTGTKLRICFAEIKNESIEFLLAEIYSRESLALEEFPKLEGLDDDDNDSGTDDDEEEDDDCSLQCINN